MAKVYDAVVDAGHRAFCGPLAIARLTGVPVSHAEKMLRRCRRGGYRDRSGRKIPIRGTYPWEVTKVLRRLGCKVELLRPLETQCSLGSFVDSTKHLDAVFLVEVTGHFLVAHKGSITDNLPRMKRKVLKAWRIEAPETPKYSAERFANLDIPPKPPKPKPDVKVARYGRIQKRVAIWEAKLRRAETALKKLRRQARYYEKTL